MRKWFVQILHLLRAIAAGFAWWTAFALEFDPAEEQGLYQAIINATKAHTPEIVLCSGAVIGLSTGLIWLLPVANPQQLRLDSLVCDSLDIFRRVCFPSLPDEKTPSDQNRVTVFRYVTCAPLRTVPFWKLLWDLVRSASPSTGWLTIANRSRCLTKLSRTAFFIPDDASRCEGVAGQAFRNRVLRVGRKHKPLPNLNPDAVAKLSAEDQEAAIQKYAEMSWVTPGWVRRRIRDRRAVPTSIVGHPIQTEDGTMWGVLVIDSCNEHACIDTDSDAFQRGMAELVNDLRRFGLVN